MTESQKSLILIVDDNEFNRIQLEKILSKSGFNTALAQDGVETLDFVAHTLPDLILMDVNMPNMDGFEACRRLKEIDATQSIPVIFITAHGETKSILNGFQVGGVDYIVKPFTKEEVLARVNVHHNLQKANQKNLDALAALRKSHDDLLSVLNQLRVGTVIVNQQDRIEFVSESCNFIDENQRLDALGKNWEDVLPFLDDSREQLRHLIGIQSHERSRSTLMLENSAQKRFWLEVEVREDPRNPERLIICLYDVTEIYQLRDQVHRGEYGKMIGRSQPMLRMFETFEQVAKGDWTVLIEGETGVGKELVAHSIHAASDRKNGPFIAVNCAGLSESLLTSQLFGHRRGAFTGAISDQAGFFEAAQGGTIFLDEIGDISPAVQSSLLRVLQEHEVTRIGDSVPRRVNARILTATNKDLADMVSQGTFREDLLYRIRIARIRVPTLKERKDDIPLLLEAFLAEKRIAIGKPNIIFSTEAMQKIMDYHWPGNVRELSNVIDYCVIHAQKSVIHVIDLPEEILTPAPASSVQMDPIEDEKSRLLSALQEAKGNRTLAARKLGISRATFYRHLEKFDITSHD